MAEEWHIPPWEVEEECTTYWYQNYICWKTAHKLEAERKAKNG